VKAGVAREILVQVAYAIGVAEPVGLYVNTYSTAKVTGSDGTILSDGEISKKVQSIFDLRPYGIVKRYGLKDPIFSETAAYGHFGRKPFEKEVEVYYSDEHTVSRVENGKEVHYKKVKFFSWEELDAVDEIQKAFGL
jgi:S-adenosylmethionine synthetase